MILKNKEEAQLHFKQLQDAIEKENIPVFFQEPILEKQTKYKTSFSVNIDLKADKKLIIPILKKYGFILEDNKIIYVGEIPAKIIIENNLTLEEYLINFQAVLYLNKKKGMTSFDVVNEISNLFGFKRVGHTGTLDPLAEGVLLVTINKATKIGELLTAEDKEYIAEVELGYETDTYDSTGTITKEKEIPKTINLEQTLNSFKKTYLQEVPIYSAIKVNGKKLYEYARKNESVELPKKEVTIKEISLLNKKENSFTFKALVTKGCYIRSLIRDIGLELNTYATMTGLTRTKQGKVDISNTNTLEEIKNNQFKYYKIEEVLDYPIINIPDELLKKISNGMKIPNNWHIEDKVIFTHNQKLIGIYQVQDNYLKVWKNFN